MIPAVARRPHARFRRLPVPLGGLFKATGNQAPFGTRLRRRGGFGIPTVFVGDAIFFGKDRLRDVEEEIVRQQAA